jgi:hypothetical protein
MVERTMMTRHLLAAALATALGACATTPAPAPTPARVERDWLADIDAEAARAPSAVDVVPLPDPAVDDLRQRATQALRERRWDEADADLQAALALRPEDPALWQARAEAAIGRASWADVETFATRSHALGPKVGALCVRNWLSVFAARIEIGDAVGAATARAAVQRCVVDAPARF